ncbi:hypothetical protein G3I40_24640 [Streptomyces sp. SID14478]|uniref:hypothetical protein n=1 Tax=Streptomyces sp. SID14478 TaxID=2706073 RepID=UPI0013DC60CB|nr:hypothetical protein [Streptomyces sp. SID14478]NEB78386.1 hypothetical protein [Streptomyces sp. SID14478]
MHRHKEDGEVLVIVAMVLGTISVVCIGVTARQCTTDQVALGPPVIALVTAFTAVALLLTATAYGH